MVQSSTTSAPVALAGIDWGTSNRRAYLLDAHGGCLAAHADDQGVLAACLDFAGSLAALLARLDVPDGVPVVASGMVGSAQGWREVPYLDIDVPLEALPGHLAPVALPDAARCCAIVPGYVQREAGGRVDVMRGEETQLLGAVALGRRDGWVVLPGTHSKWVLLQDGVVRHIATFMTGELFALLGKEGTLAAAMADRGRDGADEEEDTGFAAGLDEARRQAPLSQALFGVRARVVAGALPRAQARGVVSGLLVGAEFAALRALPGAPVDVAAAIGSAALCERYARAAKRFGIRLEPLDADRVYCAALARLVEGIKP
nr:2-keto-3-deoxy-galactonokinase [uncultured organism]